MNLSLQNLNFIKRVKKDLKKLESTMLSEMSGYDPTLIEAASHLMKAGGKRLRPVMVFLASRATLPTGTEPSFAHQRLAMAVEVLHTATLIHDDIIDNASLRRGLPTVNNQWNQRTSVLAGDFLLARSCFYISEIEIVRLNTIFAQMVMEMCNGEMYQSHRRYKSDLTLDEYLQQIRLKTALLMAIGCQGVALINQLSPEEENALYHFGHDVGMAFQVMDDILDFTVSADDTGKDSFHDLAEGQITLPSYLALQNSPHAVELKEIIDRHLEREGDLERATAIVLESDALDASRAMALDFARRAVSHLDVLPQSDAVSSMQELAEFAIQRKL